MNSDFLPFSKPSISDSDIERVSNVLRSGWITTGKEAAEFESIMCNLTGADEAVALTSATAGMHLVLHAMGIGIGDEVITPSLTWVSTVNMITLCGATPVFVDVDKDTLMIKKESIEKAITKNTRLIIPVHYAGAPVDLDPIYELAVKHDIAVVEDAAHALGTKYKGEHVGKKGTAIFSFHPIKNATTGEGGVVTSCDKSLIDRIRRLKFHGLGVDAFDRKTEEAKTQGRSPQAEVLEPGFKYNLPDILATLGVGQLARLEEFNEKRRELAALYHEAFKDVKGIIPLKVPTYEHSHSWHLFIIRVDTDTLSITRDEFMDELKKRNIGTGLHFKAAHLHSYYKNSDKGKKEELENTGLVNTQWNSDRICSIPLFPDMTNNDVIRVVNAIKEIVSNHE